MSILFNCSKCASTLQVDDGLAGKICRCPTCSEIVTVPAATYSTSPEPVSAESRRLKIACPSCQATLQYPEHLEGTRGACKACKSVFTLAQGSQSTSKPVAADSFAFECPKCKHLFEGKPGMEGRKGKCTECSVVFIINPMPKASPSKSVNPPVNKPVKEPVKSSVRPPVNPPAKRPVSRQPPTTRPVVNQPALPSEEPNIWDTLNLPAASQDVVMSSRSALENPYAASNTATAAPVPPFISGMSGPVQDRNSLNSIAYWHRAICTSILGQLMLVLVLVLGMLVLGLLVNLIGESPALGIIALIIYCVVLLTSLVLSIRVVIGIVMLTIKLYQSETAVLILVLFFLFQWCVPFLGLIILIILMLKAKEVLKAHRYQVGFLGVDSRYLR